MPLTAGGVLCALPPPLKAELPPPYTAIASSDAGGVPVINCRVCQSLIHLDGKMHQHVVKCTVCNEATVSPLLSVFLGLPPPLTSHGSSSPSRTLLLGKST